MPQQAQALKNVLDVERLEKNHEIVVNENRLLNNQVQKLEEQVKSSISLSDVRSIAKLVAQESVKLYNDRPKSLYLVQSETEVKDNNIIVQFYFEYKVNFTKGTYLPDDGIQSARFVEAAAVFALSLNKIYKGKVIATSVVFEGSADTILGSKKVDAYGGSFGEIKESALINGENRIINIYPNDTITNADLAFLRAYGIYRSFASILDDHGLTLDKSTVKFVANENKKYGSENRYGKIIFKIDNEIATKY